MHEHPWELGRSEVPSAEDTLQGFSRGEHLSRLATLHAVASRVRPNTIHEPAIRPDMPASNRLPSKNARFSWLLGCDYEFGYYTPAV